MPESSEPKDPEALPGEQEGIADLVRRALIQVADMQTMEERLKEISERASKVTPPPEEPPAD